MDKNRCIRQMAALGIGINIFLCAVKLVGGCFTGSEAVTADGIHSAVDVLITLGAYLGARLAAKAPDARHPKGHGMFEYYTAMALGLILALTGLSVGGGGIEGILAGAPVADGQGELLAAGIALLAIGVKYLAYRLTLKMAREIGSQAFIAEAKHHLADAVSSIGALAGVGGTILGAWYMESIACIFIAVLIGKTGVEIILESCKGLKRLRTEE